MRVVVAPRSQVSNGGDHEHRVRDVSLELTRAARPGDDRGVEAGAAVEQEAAPVAGPRPIRSNDRRSSDASSWAVASTGSCGDPERAGVHVVEPPGKRRQRGLGADEPVRGLVERAVAAEHRDDLDAPSCAAAGEPGRVAAPGGLHDLEVVVGAERLLDHDPLARPSPTTRWCSR